MVQFFSQLIFLAPSHKKTVFSKVFQRFSIWSHWSKHWISPMCFFLPLLPLSLLSGIRQRIELQTTILQLAHPSFWQQINKRSTRGQLYKSWVAFPLMTNYQNVFYSLAHNTYLTDGEVRATKRDITCRFLIGWFLSFVVVSRFLLIFLPPPHIYYI